MSDKKERLKQRNKEVREATLKCKKSILNGVIKPLRRRLLRSFSYQYAQ